MSSQKTSTHPETSKKLAVSAIATLIVSIIVFYLGNRYTETLLSYDGDVSQHTSQAFTEMFPLIWKTPFHLDTHTASLIVGLTLCILLWLAWVYYIQNMEVLRVGEENGSARWGTKKEGKQFLDTTRKDNNLLFTENFGLALSRPTFNQELDRNLNVLVVGGSGSGKTRNYVIPNTCQLNTNYFITDPKGLTS